MMDVRLRADAQANRREIVEAAARLFCARGLEVTFDEIAAAAGVGRATIYRHYRTRDALLAGIFERLVEDLEVLAAELEHGPGRFDTLFELVVSHQVRSLPLVQLLPPKDALPDELLALRGRIEDLFREPLAEAQEAGCVRSGLSPADIRVLVSMLTAIVRPGTPDADRERAWSLARATYAPEPALVPDRRDGAGRVHA